MAWLSGGWGERFGSTIDNSVVDAELTWFATPLICVSGLAGKGAVDISEIFDDLGANNLKLAVTANNGTTELYVEIEDWDHVAEDFVLWAGLDGHVIDDNPGTAEKIYLYWDATHADNSAKVAVVGARTEVWDANAGAVWHLSEASDATVVDSTSNNNDSSVDDFTSAAGKLANAADFDGSADSISVPADASLRPTTLTVEFWARFDDVGVTLAGIICQAYAFADKKGYDIFLGSNSLYIRVGDGANTHDKTLDITTGYEGVLRHYAFTYDGTNMRIYVDGADVGSPTAWSGTISYDANVLLLGDHKAVGAYFYDGLIDELRISSGARSAAWTKANVYAQDDDFLTWGSKETATAIKTVNGVAYAVIKTINGVAIADIKSVSGVSNVS